MLKPEDYTLVGTLNKPHGVNGRLNFAFNPGWMNEVEEYPFIFLMHESCLVPYKVEAIQFSGDEKGQIELEDIRSVEEAATLTGRNFYLPNKRLANVSGTDYAHLLIGFTVYDQDGKPVGTISDFMDIPGNPVIEVKSMLTEVLLPFHENLILKFSKENKSITLAIAEGLL